MISKQFKKKSIKNWKMKNLISKSESIFIAGGHGMVGKAYDIKNLLNFGYGKSDEGGKTLRPQKKRT